MLTLVEVVRPSKSWVFGPGCWEYISGAGVQRSVVLYGIVYTDGARRRVKNPVIRFSHLEFIDNCGDHAAQVFRRLEVFLETFGQG